MSNGSPAVSAAGSAGGGIAFLRRQFELRVDPVYEAPMKPPVRKRPVSLRDPKTVSAKTTSDDCSDRSEHVQPLKPKPREASSLSELPSSPGHAPSTSLSSSSSSSSSTSSSSSQPAVAAATGSSRITPQEADDRQLKEIKERGDEGTPNGLMGDTQDTDLTTTPQFHLSDENTQKDFQESTAELTEAEVSDKLKTKDTSSTSDRTKETNDTSCLNSDAGEANIASIPACNPPALESLTGVLKTPMKGKDTQRAENVAERRPPEETVSAQKSPNTKTYLSSSATPRKPWMPVARSMENLCSTSAGTPTKELNTSFEKKPSAINALLTATAADVVTTSQSLDRSTSLATKAKPPIRAKKAPPPVPKKNVKFTEAPKSCLAVDDEAKEDSNANTKLSSEEENSSIPSEATPGSEGGDQTLRSVPMRAGAGAQVKVPRPNSFFPPMQTTTTLRHAVEPDFDRYKSLPTLIHGDSPLRNQKDTMFPCSRQKLRPQVLQQSSHIGAAALTPDFCQRSYIGESLASPMSLGNRTPPGIDSVITSTEDSVADGHQSSSNCPLVSPLPTTVDSDMCHASKVTPYTVLPTSSSDGETIDAASATEQQMSNQFSDISDADSFLEDAFEFLGCDAHPIEDGTYASPLKLWTDTWCQSSTKNHRESPLRASTTGSKVNDGQKSIEKSTKDDNKVQEKTEKSKLQNAAKIEENRQRTIEDKQDLRRKGSFALGGDRKAPGDAKAADAERSTPFGVVLRPKNTCSLSRRSTFVSATPAKSATDASSSSPASPAASASESNRRSTVILRSSTVARPLSRLPSLPQSLTILPSNRPTAKVPGKYIGGKPSVILDGTTSSTKEDKKTDIETELDAIDKAFDFLDDSGA